MCIRDRAASADSNEWEAVENGTGSSLRLTQSEVGQFLRTVVRYTDAYGEEESVASAVTAAVGNINDPVSGSIRLLGSPSKGQIFSVDTTSILDEDGVGEFSYQWFSGGVAIDGANGTTFIPGDDEVNKSLKVEVSFNDGFGNPETLISQESQKISNANLNPAEGTVRLIGTPRQGAMLTAETSTIKDGDGLGEFNYQWFADGELISGAEEATLVLSQDQVNKAIVSEVFFTDGADSVEIKRSGELSLIHI